MEKTIEERAENIYKGNTVEQDAYIQGSTDQRKIDIEKTCDYFMEFNVDAPIKVDIDSWRQFITRILEK